MRLEKTRLAVYATAKRIQGYHLLRNPQGASPLELTMLKTNKSVYWTGDVVTNYDRVTKNFSEGSKTVKDYLFSKKYYSSNPDAPKESFKHYINLTNGARKTKGTELDRFEAPFLSKEEYIELAAKEHDTYYKKNTGIIEKIVDFCFGFADKSDKPQRPNFFKVLYNNLMPKQ